MKPNKLLLAACLMAANILPLTMLAQTNRTRPAYSASNQLRNYSSVTPSSAQRAGPGQNPDVPIDGGLSLLAAAGIAYGAKKLYRKKTK